MEWTVLGNLNHSFAQLKCMQYLFPNEDIIFFSFSPQKVKQEVSTHNAHSIVAKLIFYTVINWIIVNLLFTKEKNCVFLCCWMYSLFFSILLFILCACAICTFFYIIETNRLVYFIKLSDLHRQVYFEY